MIFTAPIQVYGEGNYAISVVKEIKVTYEYLGMDENVRNCQSIEPFENCTSKLYMDTVKEKCNCIPFSLKNFNEDVVSKALITALKLFNVYKFSDTNLQL